MSRIIDNFLSEGIFIMKKIAVLLLLLLILALVPLTAFFDFSPAKKTSSENNYETNDKSQSLAEPAVMCAAVYFSEDLEPDTLKALCLVCQNNCRADKDYIKNSENYLSDNSMKERWKQSYSKNLKKLRDALDAVKNMKITYNGKEVIIPLSYISNGKTATDDEYPFLQSVASPWDKISNEYSKNGKSLGVSVYGMNYIIKQGKAFTTALLWYLPDFEITER